MPTILSSNETTHIPRVIFFGMQCAFSPPVLTALLQSDIEVCAIVLPARAFPGKQPAPIQRQSMPLRTLSLLSDTRPDIIQVAASRKIPLWNVSQLAHADTVQALAAYQPDIICVACFPDFIPRAIRELAGRAFLNVHPSLLPANRGPMPLFWTFREGHEKTGVTIHRVESRMDSGAIYAQETIPVTPGILYSDLEQDCAKIGGRLLADTIWALFKGQAISIPQDEKQKTYHTYPVAEDCVIRPHEWQARPLYTFLHALHDWDLPLLLDCGSGEHRHILHGISYSHNEEFDHVRSNLYGHPVGDQPLFQESPTNPNTAHQSHCLECQDGNVWVVLEA